MSKMNCCLTRSAAIFCVAGALVLPTLAGAIETANLLANGNAEVHRCTDDWSAQTPVPGWRVLRGAVSVLCLSAFDWTHEGPALPSKESAGAALFSSPGADTAMEQAVDVSNAAASIDAGQVEFSLSAWLGGWRGRSERATITAVFLDEAGRATGTPVVVAELGGRHGIERTGLVARGARGPLPGKTRRVIVTVQFPGGMTSYHNAFADNIRLTLIGDVPSLAAAQSSPPKASIPKLDHVYVVMMENTNYSDVVRTEGRSVSIHEDRMPFLASLAKRGVILTNMWANYHPSDQNYVAMVAGDTFRYGPVYFPDYDLPVTHLGDLLEARGKSWKAYVQNMKTPCNLETDADGEGFYAPDDQPFVHFENVIGDPVRCIKSTRDLTDFKAAIDRNSLPAFAWIAADGWWDGEGAWWDAKDVGVSLVKQDEFLKSTFQSLLESEDWRRSRSLLIVTWDESLGWGWPDNRVATVLIGSPGLLRAGTVDDTHYDGYSVLRTIEEAFDLRGLDRFDEFAQPLNLPFAGRSTPERGRPGDLVVSESATTRGSIDDTFGQVTTPAAVVQGNPLEFVVPKDSSDDAVVNLEPLGQVPSSRSADFRPDARTGGVSIATERLAPGMYGAWLRQGEDPPHRAPYVVTILPASLVVPSAPGVEIVGAPSSAGKSARIRILENSNLIVRYCRPDDALPEETWVGIFEAGTPIEQMTKENADVIGFWLKTPGQEGDQACGEAMAFASELLPETEYQIRLFRDGVNGSRAVGRKAAFILTPTLP
jgi:hypothetical protein